MSGRWPRTFTSPARARRRHLRTKRPAPPDSRWLVATSDAPPSVGCCTSWSHATRRPCSPSYATPTAVVCRAMSIASLPSTCAVASSPTASRACVARPATTSSSSRSRANAAASARPARPGGWRTSPRISSTASCRARHTVRGSSPCPSRCACASPGTRRGPSRRAAARKRGRRVGRRRGRRPAS